MSEAAQHLDKRAARRAFNAAADSYDAAAALQREIGERMLERLEYIRLQPKTIMDLGCGTGHALPILNQLYPNAEFIAVDMAQAMLQKVPTPSKLKRWFGKQKPVQKVCADAENLPFSDNSVDLIVSNVALQWVNDPEQTFAGLRRILRPGGLLMFTTFGPDTLKELRTSWQAVNRQAHVHGFIDMHDLGDALMRAKFAEPVMDCERLIMTYETVQDLVTDLKDIGAHNAEEGRPQGLTPPQAWKKMLATYEGFRRDEDGRLPATWEVVYGHAWAPETGQKVSVPEWP